MVDPAPPGARKRLVDSYAAYWVRDNPEAVIEWAYSLPVRDRYEAVAGITDALSDDEGGLMHVEIAELIDSDSNIARTFALYHAESWAIADSSAAFEWASKITAPVTRRKALEEVMKYWGRNNPVAASSAIDAATGLSGGDWAAMQALLPKPAAPAGGS